MDKYITIWRQADDIFAWDFHKSENIEEARRVVENLKMSGVEHYVTNIIGSQMSELTSSKFGGQHD